MSKSAKSFLGTFVERELLLLNLLLILSGKVGKYQLQNIRFTKNKHCQFANDGLRIKHLLFG